MRTIFVNETKKFKMKIRYNFVISNDFIIRAKLKFLLIIKRKIKLSVDVNEKIVISSLNVSSDRFIIKFKSNAFKKIFNKIFFEIKMKFSKLLTFSSTIIYIF